MLLQVEALARDASAAGRVETVLTAVEQLLALSVSDELRTWRLASSRNPFRVHTSLKAGETADTVILMPNATAGNRSNTIIDPESFWCSNGAPQPFWPRPPCIWLARRALCMLS